MKNLIGIISDQEKEQDNMQKRFWNNDVERQGR